MGRYVYLFEGRGAEKKLKMLGVGCMNSSLLNQYRVDMSARYDGDVKAR